MSGITNKEELLRLMAPEVVPGEFVFCAVSERVLPRLKVKPKLIFREKEGVTIILTKKEAEKEKLPFDGIWSLITLSVHSGLSAVGFLANITPELAKKKISVNVVSAYFHDHLFVPINKTQEALTALKRLSKEAGFSYQTKEKQTL